tara:strand:+ start:320 stop:481 length:162 start_codon:yes stop_codon:yes gene_type:complete
MTKGAPLAQRPSHVVLELLGTPAPGARIHSPGRPPATIAWMEICHAELRVLTI